MVLHFKIIEITSLDKSENVACFERGIEVVSDYASKHRTFYGVFEMS